MPLQGVVLYCENTRFLHSCTAWRTASFCDNRQFGHFRIETRQNLANNRECEPFSAKPVKLCDEYTRHIWFGLEKNVKVLDRTSRFAIAEAKKFLSCWYSECRLLPSEISVGPDGSIIFEWPGPRITQIVQFDDSDRTLTVIDRLSRTSHTRPF